MHQALTRTVRRKHRVTAGITGVAVAAVTAGVAYGALPATAGAVPKDYSGPTWTTSAVTSPTADKQQSKLWRAGRAWWAVMVSSTKGVPTIHERRTNNTWRDTGTVVDNRADSTADVWYSGRRLYVVSRTMTGDIRYYRFSFHGTTRSYTKVRGFPVRLAPGGTESASLAKDSTGRIWATWTQGGRVYVTRSYSAVRDKKWIPPRVVPSPDTTVSGDDVSTIVAWDHKIGVMWSDQQDDVFRFAIHTDGTGADKSWTTETPIPSMPDLADDHISLKASGRRVFAAVKTSFDDAGATPSSPMIYLLRRDRSGRWVRAKAASLGDKLTRPQIALDRTNHRIYFFASGPSSSGKIYYKSSPFVGLRFARGRGAPVISNDGSRLTDVTTLKSSVPQAAGLTVLASDTLHQRYFHGRLSLAPADRQPPITQNTIHSVNNGDGSVTTSWPLATDDRFVVAYDVYVRKSGGTKKKIKTIDATSAGNVDLRRFSVTHSPGTGTWRYSIQARDAAGNVSDEETATAVTVS